MAASPLTEDVVERIRREVRRLAPAQDVDDLAQEACVRVIEKEGLWREERGGFTTWAGTVARNLVRGRLQRSALEGEARRTRAELDSAAELDALSEERIAWVLEQFRHLPEDARRVLTWRYLDGRSVADIAEELGVSSSAVSQRIARALSELRARARGGEVLGMGIGTWMAANKMKTALIGVALASATAGTAFYLQDETARVVGTTRDQRHTEFTAALDTPLDPARNTLWCASAPLAWAELMAFTGGPIELDTRPAVVDRLNASRFPADEVDARSWVAGAGLTDDGTVDRLQAELRREFGQGRDPVLDRIVAAAGPGQLLTYAFLAKELAWRTEFEDFDEPLAFRYPADASTSGEPGADGVATAHVAAFGITELSTHSLPWHERVAEQVVVHEDDTDEFVVALGSEGQTDRVLLARVDPRASLEETMDRALELAATPPRRMRNGDRLGVPVLDLDLAHSYRDLVGRLETGRFAGRNLSIALQTIRFRLDHRGALLRSRFAAAGAESEDAPTPRRLVFDEPFLILMREPGRTPYLAIWVAHPELLVAFGTPEAPAER